MVFLSLSVLLSSKADESGNMACGRLLSLPLPLTLLPRELFNWFGLSPTAASVIGWANDEYYI